MTTQNVYLIRPDNGGNALVVSSGDELVSYLDRCKCAITVEQIEMYEVETSHNTPFFESHFEVCWHNAPPWAKYHAYDSSGTGYFYEIMPTVDRLLWSVNRSDACCRSGFLNVNVDRENFKESLTTRPNIK